MLRILVISFFLLVNLPILCAQVIKLSPATDIKKGYATNDEILLEVRFINHSTSASTFKWVKKLNLPYGWELGFCIGACYTDSTGKFDLNSNTDTTISFHFYPNNIADTGYVEILVYNSVDSANTVVKGNYTGIALEPDAIAEKIKNRINIYPSLAQTDITVSYSDVVINRIEIHNLTGSLEIVDLPNYNSKQTIINISNLSSGIHFISLIDENNRMILTKKFQKID